MAERRNAARFRELPALVPGAKDLAPRPTQLAPAARLRAAWLSATVGIGLVIVVSLTVDLALNIGRDQRTAVGTSTTFRSHLGPGYPEHHGLAGPSRVGTNAGSWLGYPPHFGLAGPSQVRPTAVSIGIGAGYPPHYGLAGPSHVDDGR
jgi:hypothetical protein